MPRLVALAMFVLVASVTACGDDRATSSASSTAGAGGTTAGTPSMGGAGGMGGVGTGGGGGGGGVGPERPPPPRVLLFTKGDGHFGAGPLAVAALQAAGQARGWLSVDVTDDAATFTPATLATFDVVVWLLNGGPDMLDDTQQAAFEAYIQADGGYVGVHSANATEYQWPWYGDLVGARFLDHPAPQQADLRVERGSHRSTGGLPLTWSRLDEWYNFYTNPRQDVTVLVSIDETSYDPAAAISPGMGDHPISWYHGHDGGRAWYTAMGHTHESWADVAFVDHVAGGIEWAGGLLQDDLVLSELDGVEPNGTWKVSSAAGFAHSVGPEALTIIDDTGAPQHLVRSGVGVDPTRRYVVEALVIVTTPGGPAPNAVSLDLNVSAGRDTLSTWAVELDLSPVAPGGVLRSKGYVNGQTGVVLAETMTSWGAPDTEYLLRATVDGTQVDATVLHEGLTLEELSSDFAGFSYQPDPNAAVDIGVSTHSADVAVRSLRVFYLD